MNKEEIREQFSSLLDGELSPEERQDLENALSQDAEMLRELAKIKQVDTLFRRMPKVETPAHFDADVRNAIRPRLLAFGRRGDSRRPIWPLLASAAMLTLVSGLIWYMMPTQAPLELAGSLEEAQPTSNMYKLKAAKPDVQAEIATSESAPPAPKATPADAIDRLDSRQEMPSLQSMTDRALSPDPSGNAPVPAQQNDLRLKSLGYSAAAKKESGENAGSETSKDADAPLDVADGMLADEIEPQARFNVQGADDGTSAGGSALGQILAQRPALSNEMKSVDEVDNAIAGAKVESEQFPKQKSESIATPAPPASAAPASPMAVAEPVEQTKLAIEGPQAKEAAAESAKPSEEMLTLSVTTPKRAFNVDSGVWTEKGYAGEPLTTVIVDSDAYKSLVQKYPDTAEFAGLGSRVIAKIDSKWYAFEREPKK